MTIIKAKSILGLRGWINNDSTREDIETFYKELINYWKEKDKQNIIEIIKSAKKSLMKLRLQIQKVF